MNRLANSIRSRVINYTAHTNRTMASSGSAFLVDDPSHSFLRDLGLERINKGVYSGKWSGAGQVVQSICPSTGKIIAEVATGTKEELDNCITAGTQAFAQWKKITAPHRGEIIRQIGNELRKYKEPLGRLISLEMGKVLPEGLGEVQEFVDICDYAVGLSRIAGGQYLNSERPGHYILEKWNPLGLVGVISAFNFPCAVYGWNAALAFAVGDTILWKGAQTTPLVAIATTKIVAEVFKRNDLPAVATLCQGGADVGKQMVADDRVKLVSFTGSTAVGREVGVEVQKRFGKLILELGGNNALIINEDASFEMAMNAAFFGCIGTAGQRCTTTRRLIIHEKLYDQFLAELKKRYQGLMKRVGHPLDNTTLYGPVHNQLAIDNYKTTIEQVKQLGGVIEFGGNVIDRPGFYVEPTIVTHLPYDSPAIKKETFAPIVYVLKAKNLEEAIEMNNSVDQGLSSAIFTKDAGAQAQFHSESGSDCGLININTSTSGAEIGGAFGGEKHSGCGRESGSDAWKYYCRRATVTVNASADLPLAQGIVFE